MSQPHTRERFDIVVGGAGYVGLATAVAIRASAPELSVVVVDAAPENAWQTNGPRRLPLQQAACSIILASGARSPSMQSRSAT
jgi:2-octaprenyl-6-methoxyphenol hydroxylase